MIVIYLIYPNDLKGWVLTMEEFLFKIQSKKKGVSEELICNSEKKLGAKFPDQYRELIMVANKPEIGEWQFYPIKDPNNIKRTFDDVIRANLDINNRSQVYDLIFIAENGTGDQLCFKVQNNIMLEPVFIWEHENGNLNKIAGNLKAFILKNVKY